MRPDVELPGCYEFPPLVSLSYRIFSGLNTFSPAATGSATATSAMRRGAGRPRKEEEAGGVANPSTDDTDDSASKRVDRAE